MQRIREGGAAVFAASLICFLSSSYTLNTAARVMLLMRVAMLARVTLLCHGVAGGAALLLYMVISTHLTSLTWSLSR